VPKFKQDKATYTWSQPTHTKYTGILRMCYTYFMTILAQNVSFKIPVFWRHWCHINFIIQIFPQLKK